jgi:hypothetical protein
MGEASVKRLFETTHLDTINTYLYNALPKLFDSLYI